MTHDADRTGAAGPPPPAPPRDPASGSGSSFEQDPTIAAGDVRSGSVGTSGPIPSAANLDLPPVVGRYRILRKLGEGGMGIVYEAEQQDPRRRVALKVVRGGRFVDETTIRMFRREAETLARLRHPNIGAIYESGRTEDGQHFFAMELVQGDNLDAYLARRGRATTPEEVRFRLALFRRIAEAVHYAHQRGVIHRDLKPSNIVISGEAGSSASVTTLSGMRLPDVKILDFGLARITEGDVQATQMTEVGVIKGTLPYMAPEQARGHAEAIDVRTDVYALGVLLYEMLSGAKPYDVSRGSLIEAVRVICEEPPRSLRSSLSGTRRLDPDIETIVGKALEKDAERRYASAEAMAQDVERYLASQPIMARPPSTVYQLRKFAGRNRALVSGLAATFAVLVAGVAVSSFQAVRAHRAEVLATSRMARALSAEALALVRRREAEQARTMAEQARLAAEQGRTEAETQKAIAVRERAVAATQRKAAEASSEQAHVEAAKAGAINRFLQEMLATADPWSGDAGKVTLDAALERARTRIGAWAGTDPDVESAIRGTLATAFAGVGRYADADSLLQGGIARLDAEGGRPALVAALHRQLGAIMMQASRYERAERELRQALVTQSGAGAAASDTVALMLGQLASALAYQGRYAQADSVAGAAMGMARAVGAESGAAVPAILRTRAYVEANWRQDFAAADSLLGASAVLLAARPGDHVIESSELLEEAAANRVRMGDLAGADSLYRKAVAIRRRAFGDNHPLVARALEREGQFLYRAGRTDQTIEVLRQVLAIQQRGLGPESAPVGRTWASLGPVYTRAGRLPEAESALVTGVTILRRRLGDRHPDVAAALVDFADLRARQRKLGDAEKLAREALAIRLERLGPGNPGTVASQLALADVLRARHTGKSFAEAEAVLLAARSACIAARGKGDPGVLSATRALVRLYDDWKKPKQSAWWRATLPAAEPAAATTLSGS